jgi:glycosyltransferase involved in cell wall biosynthesis
MSNPSASVALSVVICTHNPRPEPLERTLRSLRAQTLPLATWELLIVDNASAPPLRERLDLSWHPRARIVEEPTLGLTTARLAGIRHSSAPLLVGVDDDNVLATDYLAVALALGSEKPFLGVWGGAVVPEFETPPPDWITPYLGLLALRDPRTEIWAKSDTLTDAIPCGAGICYRRPVALRWMESMATNPLRLRLGRIGQALGSGEDGDLAFTACDLGLATGVFPRLRLVHLIPARRLTLDYMERLVEDMHRSEVLLRSLRHRIEPPPSPGIATRLFRLYGELRMSEPVRRLMRASARGTRSGYVLATGLPDSQPSKPA